MFYFFRIRRTERGSQSEITLQFSLEEPFSPVLSFGSFFLITSISFNFSVSISSLRSWKAILKFEKGEMNDIQDWEASSVADRSREHVEPGPAREDNRILDRTYSG